jgi:hypothetical protein
MEITGDMKYSYRGTITDLRRDSLIQNAATRRTDPAVAPLGNDNCRGATTKTILLCSYRSLSVY